MRPRVFPAENAFNTNPAARMRSRFNEAAGIPRGKPAHRTRTAAIATASMRPRVFPAENIRLHNPVFGVQPRFNEAAGIPRGKRTVKSFQRAGLREASMRPRVFPAENGPLATRCNSRRSPPDREMSRDRHGRVVADAIRPTMEGV